MGAVNVELFVAIAAGGHACILRDRQPNAGMAQRALATITGNFPRGDDLNLGCGCHVMSFCSECCAYSNPLAQGSKGYTARAAAF